MNSTPVTQSNYKSHSCRGFALVVALSLMAFILVLVVTILSLIEVETRSAGNSLEIQRAREGARLALNMAIGQLQEYAGDDERVTARADILGDDAGSGASNFDAKAKYWTGVWDSSDASEDPNWLVSWHDSNSDPDPDNLPSDNQLMRLVGEGSIDDDTDDADHVFAPFINIFDTNGNVTSRIAWWIGDEGVKASVAQLPLNRRTNNPSFTPDASLGALYTMLATSHGLERVFTNYNRFSSAESAFIDGVSSIDQLISQASFQSWDFEYEDGSITVSEDPFHTLTPMSYGVLASTTPDTGLMQDLSQFPGVISAGFASYINRGFNAAGAKSGATPGTIPAMRRTTAISGPGSIGSLSDGDIIDFAAPVLTNFMMAFAVYESADLSAPNPLLRMHFFSEFWNSYTSTLAMNDGVNNYELELEITGLPSVQVRIVGGSTGSAINIQDLLGSGGAGTPIIVRLKYDQNEEWHPGMTKNWTGVKNAAGPSPYDSDQTLTKDWSSAIYTLGGDDGISTGVARASIQATDEFQIFSVGSHDINVAVYIVNLGTGARSLLTEINGIQYSNVDVPGGATGIPLGTNEATFGYHFILKGPSSGSLTYHRGDWLSSNDPRNPSGSNAYIPVKDGSVELASADPHEIKDYNTSSIDIEEFQRLFDRSDSDSDFPLVSGGKYNRLWQEAPLFELPRERILSLASLQHLYLHNERPFKVGNSWGDDSATDTLAWFDQYFLSGLSLSDDLSSFTQHEGFPSPILIPYQYSDPNDFDDDSRAVARNALVANRFNLNSTSVSAWKAVLGGLRISNWPYLDYYPEGNSNDLRIVPDPDPLFPLLDGDDDTGVAQRISRGNMFTRFPSTLHETYDVFTTPEDSGTIAPSEFYRRGVRYLTPQQVEDLAVSIVSQIKARFQLVDAPFFSVKDFLNNPNISNGSILEEAIKVSVFTNPGDINIQQWDRSWEISGSGEDDDTDRIDIDHFSPGFLTQADIMTAIGPMLAPRSDTFKIRARCETFSPFDPDEVVGSATIEAIVQRVPDPVDPDNDDINDSIERKFKITSVRWLTEDEL